MGMCVRAYRVGWTGNRKRIPNERTQEARVQRSCREREASQKIFGPTHAWDPVQSILCPEGKCYLVGAGSEIKGSTLPQALNFHTLFHLGLWLPGLDKWNC